MTKMGRDTSRQKETNHASGNDFAVSVARAGDGVGLSGFSATPNLMIPDAPVKAKRLCSQHSVGVGHQKPENACIALYSSS